MDVASLLGGILVGALVGGGVAFIFGSVLGSLLRPANGGAKDLPTVLQETVASLKEDNCLHVELHVSRHKMDDDDDDDEPECTCPLPSPNFQVNPEPAWGRN